MPRLRRLLCPLLAGALLAASAAPCLAQTATAEITGVISDTTGAPVPHVAVLLTETSTNFKTALETNDAGVYYARISPGTYSLNATATGFKAVTVTGLQVATSQVFRNDIRLEIGDVQQTVEVSAVGGEVQLEKDSAEISTELPPQVIKGLPSITRKTYEMIDLSPGVRFPDGQTNLGYNLSAFQPFVSIAGTPGSRDHNWYVDGSNITYTRIIGDQGIMPAVNPPPETVSEVRVIANNYAAEFGGGFGGVIVVTTRAGTNQFHGEVYDYEQNGSFDARNFFSAAVTPNHYHNFGGGIGGRIIKNKTFFYANVEGELQRLGAPDVITVPTALQHTGNFSNTLDANGNLIVIYDPATTTTNASGVTTRTPFPGNIIPMSRLDPVAVNVMQYYPMPNLPGTITGADNFIGTAINTNLRRHYQSYRGDHEINERNKLFVHYFDDYTIPGSTGPFAGTVGKVADSGDRDYWLDSTTVQGGYTTIIKPTLLSELRFYWNRTDFRNEALGDQSDVWQQNWAGKLGLKNLGPDTFPSFDPEGYYGIGAYGFAQDYTGKYWIAGPSEVINWVHGDHNIRFGAEWKESDAINDFRQFPSGQSSYSPLNTALPLAPDTGNSIASLMLGQVASGQVQDQNPRDRRSWYLGAFVQDDWHIRHNLTLNIGLRYDYDSPQVDLTESYNFFNPTAINPVCNCPGILVFTKTIFAETEKHVPLYDGQNFGFGPRFGFSWNPKSSWVVRGGYGWFLPGPDIGNTVWQGPTAGATLVSETLNGNALGLSPAFVLSQGFPLAPAPQFNSTFGAVPIGQTPYYTPSFYWTKRPTTYSQQINFGIQKQITQSMVVSAFYMGNLVRKLPFNGMDFNEVPPDLVGPGNAQLVRPFPQFAGLMEYGDAFGTSNYHAGVLQVSRSFSNGFTFTSNYSYAKQLDDVSYYTSMYVHNYGPSSYDMRHRFVFGGNYELPFGPGKKWLTGRGIGNLVGNWTLTTRLTIHSGEPVFWGNDSNTCNCYTAGTQGVNLSSRPTLNSSNFNPNTEPWFNTSVVSQPAPYTFGSAGVQVYGPHFFDVDGSLVKHITFTERLVGDLRVEFFDLLNHPNWAAPDATLGDPSFGYITSTLQPGGNRVLQLGVKLHF